MLVLLAIAAVQQTAREAMKIHVKRALGGFEALVLALDFTIIGKRFGAGQLG
jgi:hypothetical protein